MAKAGVLGSSLCCLRFNLLKRALLDLVHCSAFVGAELTNFALPLKKARSC
jgi:hypothetical protein